MLRVLVLANDSLLADGIAEVLSGQVDLDVTPLVTGIGSVQKTMKQYHPNVMVVELVGTNGDSWLADLGRIVQDKDPLLVLMMPRMGEMTHVYSVHEKQRDMQVFQGYQLVNPGMQQVIQIVRDFNWANVKKNEGHRERVSLTKLTMSSRVRLRPQIQPSG